MNLIFSAVPLVCFSLGLILGYFKGYYIGHEEGLNEYSELIRVKKED